MLAARRSCRGDRKLTPAHCKIREIDDEIYILYREYEKRHTLLGDYGTHVTTDPEADFEIACHVCIRHLQLSLLYNSDRFTKLQESSRPDEIDTEFALEMAVIEAQAVSQAIGGRP